MLFSAMALAKIEDDRKSEIAVNIIITFFKSFIINNSFLIIRLIYPFSIIIILMIPKIEPVVNNKHADFFFLNISNIEPISKRPTLIAKNK